MGNQIHELLLVLLRLNLSVGGHSCVRMRSNSVQCWLCERFVSSVGPTNSKLQSAYVCGSVCQREGVCTFLYETRAFVHTRTHTHTPTSDSWVQ